MPSFGKASGSSGLKIPKLGSVSSNIGIDLSKGVNGLTGDIKLTKDKGNVFRSGATDSETVNDVSHQAVYDVLDALVIAGLVRRIQPRGSVARYEARVGDNHHHVVCRSCGAVADVDCAVGGAPCLAPSIDHRYEIDEAEVTYWGRCPACVNAEAATVR